MEKLYKPFKSKSKNKKYSVYVKQKGKVKLIHFGDSRYKQFFDKLGNYTNLNHNSIKKRDNFKNTPIYWANRILW